MRARGRPDLLRNGRKHGSTLQAARKGPRGNRRHDNLGPRARGRARRYRPRRAFLRIGHVTVHDRQHAARGRWRDSPNRFQTSPSKPGLLPKDCKVHGHGAPRSTITSIRLRSQLGFGRSRSGWHPKQGTKAQKRYRTVCRGFQGAS